MKYLRLNEIGAKKRTHIITVKFQSDIPKIYLQTCGLITTWFTYGLPLAMFGSGGSVPRAKAARVSITRLSQRS
jgi:hypothetical protein